MKRIALALTGSLLLVAGCSSLVPPPAPKSQVTLPGNASYVLDGPATALADGRLQRPLEDSIAKGLAGRGWQSRPPGVAQWRIRYDLQVETLREPALSRSLVPRLVCRTYGCQVREEWVHQGPPLRSRPDTRYRQSVLRLTITETASGKVVWQGSRAHDFPLEGPLHAAPLAHDAERLVALLPRAAY